MLSTYDIMGITFILGVIGGYMICATVVYFTILERLKKIEKMLNQKNDGHK